MTDPRINNKSKTEQKPANLSIITPGIRNYAVIDIDGREKQIPLDCDKILKQVQFLRGDWPRRSFGRLFILNHNGDVRWLDKQADLFSWMRAGNGLVYWSSKDGCVTKEEFLSYLRVSPEVQEYAAVLSYPVFPSRTEIFCPYEVKKPFTPKLDEFSDFFCFASENDKILFKAMFCTVFSSGLDGKRPLFVITSEDGDIHHGRGTGKSTMAYTFGELVGSPCKYSVKAMEDSLGRLLQTKSRVVLIDNVKGYKTSSTALEDLITAPKINGHLMYTGDYEIPNSFTYIMTYNDPSMSKDLAQRSVVIRIKRPVEDFEWSERVGAFLDLYKHDLIAEAEAVLLAQKPKVQVGMRFMPWAKNVLMAVTDDQNVIRHINNCITELDGDVEDCKEVASCLADRISDYKYLGYDKTPQDIDLSKTFILVKKSVVNEWLKREQNWSGMHATTIGKKLLRCHVPFISKVEYRSNGVRYYIFGPDAQQRVTHSLEETGQRSFWAITNGNTYGNNNICREIKADWAAGGKNEDEIKWHSYGTY